MVWAYSRMELRIHNLVLFGILPLCLWAQDKKNAEFLKKGLLDHTYWYTKLKATSFACTEPRFNLCACLQELRQTICSVARALLEEGCSAQRKRPRRCLARTHWSHHWAQVFGPCITLLSTAGYLCSVYKGFPHPSYEKFWRSQTLFSWRCCTFLLWETNKVLSVVQGLIG